MTRSDIMRKAHAIARTLSGDYRARLSWALREAWRQYRTGLLTPALRQQIVQGELGILGVWLIEQGRATLREILAISDAKAEAYIDRYGDVYASVLDDYYRLINGEPSG